MSDPSKTNRIVGPLLRLRSLAPLLAELLLQLGSPLDLNVVQVAVAVELKSTFSKVYQLMLRYL